MKITREQFIEVTGEDPIDVLGQDWENTAQEWLEDNEFACKDCGHTAATGACYSCKMD